MPRTLRRIVLALAVVAGLLVVGAAGGFVYLRQGPAGGVLNLFADGRRAENFRALHEALPSHPVAAGGDPWPFDRDERPLPERYAFEGEERSLAELLRVSETTGLLVARTLRDYARFGRLYLHEGRRDDRQVVPAAWVEDSLRPGATAMAPDAGFGAGFGYGYLWWVPDGDEGDVLAMGIWGQFVYVHPGHRAVIVKTSTDPGFAGRDRETVAAFRAIAAAVADGRP